MHMRPEGVQVRLINLETLFLEELHQFFLELELSLATELGSVVGSFLQLGLIGRRQLVEDLLADGQVVQIDQVAVSTICLVTS